LLRLIDVIITLVLQRHFFTARCTLLQSAVEWSYVCPSVCDVGGWRSHSLEFFEHNFTVS